MHYNSISRQYRNYFMRISAIRPSFKGLIVTPDGQKAINTDYITEMSEEKNHNGSISTTIWSIDGTRDTFDIPLKNILEAYKQAADIKSAIIEIKN